MTPVRLILASASPARLSTLRRAGLDPEVIVSGVDESGIDAPSVAELTARLAQLKAEAVGALVEHDPGGDQVVIGCDSLLALDGEPFGKPGSAAAAALRWRRMRGSFGVLHTGHHLLVRRGGRWTTHAGVAATTVHFADLSDAEIDAYVATGEPLQVAGAFTVDGLGGPFVTRIEGDHHNVVGISLPVLRTLLDRAGITWPSLWASRSEPPAPAGPVLSPAP